MEWKNDKNRSELADLRRRANDLLEPVPPQDRPLLDDPERQRLVHELEVHQIELEMQNEELRQSRDLMEISRNMYTELYDFAPVAYFTVDTHGAIQEVNHTGAQLFGTDRMHLVNVPFVSLIADKTGRDVYATHIKAVLNRQFVLRCEIKLKGPDGMIIIGQLQSVAIRSKIRSNAILISIVDATVRTRLEANLQEAHDNMELQVLERTEKLTKANQSIQAAYEEIKKLQSRLQAENIYLQQTINEKNNLGEIIGQCNAISKVFMMVEQVASIEATVLILGETGVGKGMVARAIHMRSTRKERPMITVNCTSLPANLIESELFGREKGAFTGAHARQIGRFELADGGTIFLDEIGEMPFDLQCKLLRVVQDGEFERLGSPRTIKVNVRIIAASNRNLVEEVRNGKFREDLFYRLNVFPITIPPLRQRKDDIPLLVDHFIDKFNRKHDKKITTVSKETLNAIMDYHWPGNVRELECVIERAVITSQGKCLQVLDRFDTSCKTEELVDQDVKDIAKLEHDHILMILRRTWWRIEGEKGAAALLGLNPSTLRARMRKYGIVRQQGKASNPSN